MAWRLDPPIVELILNCTLPQIYNELKKTNNDMNCFDSTARTPLHYCILPEEGTVRYRNNLEHDTVFEGTEQSNFRKVRKWDEVKWLDLNKPDLETLMTWPKRLAVAYLLCKYGANVNVTDPFNGGLPLLSACAQKGDLLLIQMLIHFGADTSCSNFAELAYSRGHLLCAVYIDKHCFSLRDQCRGTLRISGIKEDNLAKLRLPCSVKLHLNYRQLFTGYVEKLIPLRPFTDDDINTRNVSPDEVIAFIRKFATEKFCEGNRGILYQATHTIEKDLVMLMHKLYSQDCFHELKYEEPLARPPRYSMEPVPEKRMKELGLHRPPKVQTENKSNDGKFSIFKRILK